MGYKELAAIAAQEFWRKLLQAEIPARKGEVFSAGMKVENLIYSKIKSWDKGNAPVPDNQLSDYVIKWADAAFDRWWMDTEVAARTKSDPIPVWSDVPLLNDLFNAKGEDKTSPKAQLPETPPDVKPTEAKPAEAQPETKPLETVTQPKEETHHVEEPAPAPKVVTPQTDYDRYSQKVKSIIDQPWLLPLLGQTVVDQGRNLLDQGYSVDDAVNFVKEQIDAIKHALNKQHELSPIPAPAPHEDETEFDVRAQEILSTAPWLIPALKNMFMKQARGMLANGATVEEALNFLGQQVGSLDYSRKRKTQGARLHGADKTTTPTTSDAGNNDTKPNDDPKKDKTDALIKLSQVLDEKIRDAFGSPDVKKLIEQGKALSYNSDKVQRQMQGCTNPIMGAFSALVDEWLKSDNPPWKGYSRREYLLSYAEAVGNKYGPEIGQFLPRSDDPNTKFVPPTKPNEMPTYEALAGHPYAPPPQTTTESSKQPEDKQQVGLTPEQLKEVTDKWSKLSDADKKKVLDFMKANWGVLDPIKNWDKQSDETKMWWVRQAMIRTHLLQTVPQSIRERHEELAKEKGYPTGTVFDPAYNFKRFDAEAKKIQGLRYIPQMWRDWIVKHAKDYLEADWAWKHYDKLGKNNSVGFEPPIADKFRTDHAISMMWDEAHRIHDQELRDFKKRMEQMLASSGLKDDQKAQLRQKALTDFEENGTGTAIGHLQIFIEQKKHEYGKGLNGAIFLDLADAAIKQEPPHKQDALWGVIHAVIEIVEEETARMSPSKAREFMKEVVSGIIGGG